MEIQYGDYLGEDDIVRLDDKYGRTSDKKIKVPNALRAENIDQKKDEKKEKNLSKKRFFRRKKTSQPKT